MDWAAAHKINNNAFKIGAGWEAKVMQMFIVLSKDRELSSTDIALLLSFIQQELDKIAQTEIEALNNALTLAYGYLKEEKLKIGKFILIMAIIITVAGLTNPIGIAMGLNILGLTERLVIYPLQVLIFTLSYYYTFNLDNNYNEEV